MPKPLREFANDEQAQNHGRSRLRLLLDLTLEVIKATSSEPNLSELLLEPRPTNLDTIVFEQLWTLFTPGDIVISESFLGEAQAFIVNESLESPIESPSRGNRTRYWSLTCWAYDWTGTTFKRVPVELRVNDFRGARKIESLAVYPRRYLPPDKWQGLIERGKRFRELCIKNKGSHLHEYSGEAILRGTGVGRVNLVRNHHENGFKNTTYRKHGSRPRTEKERLKSLTSSRYSWTDIPIQLILRPSLLLKYSMSSTIIVRSDYLREARLKIGNKSWWIHLHSANSVLEYATAAIRFRWVNYAF
jgi:hypothetical protein